MSKNPFSLSTDHFSLGMLCNVNQGCQKNIIALCLEQLIKNQDHNSRQVGEDIGGSIEVYDPGLNQWRMQGTMQDARFDFHHFHHSCHFTNITHINITNSHHHNQWRMQGTMQDARFDFQTTKQPILPIIIIVNQRGYILLARFSMGIVSYQGLIYIVGGCTHSRRHMQVIIITMC